jgi:predicted PurR-regulated permease PerM
MEGNYAKSDEFAKFALRVLFVLGVVLLCILIWQLRRVLLLVFAAALVALLFRTLARVFARWTPLKKNQAIGVVLAIMLLALIAAGVVFGTQLSNQLGELSIRLPQLVSGATDYFERTSIGRLFLDLLPTQREFTNYAPQTLLTAASATIGILSPRTTREDVRS